MVGVLAQRLEQRVLRSLVRIQYTPQLEYLADEISPKTGKNKIVLIVINIKLSILDSYLG